MRNFKNIVFAATLVLIPNTVLYSADLTVSSAIPEIYYYDTDDSANIWSTYTNGQSGGRFAILDNLYSTTTLLFANSANNANSIVVDSSGDLSLVNSNLFIDRSANKVGIGTTTPTANLTVSGTSGVEIVNGEWSIRETVVSGTNTMWYTTYQNDVLQRVPILNGA